jgi:hypothetical protein
MQNLNMPPQRGFTQRSTDDLDPRTPMNNRQGLSKVTNKEDGDASEESDIINILTLLFEKVFDGTIDSFWTIVMLHGCLIPYDEFGLFQDTMHIIALCDIAGGGLIDRDGDFEA